MRITAAIKTLFLALLAAAAPDTASAHHSVSAFDGNRIVRITGTVTGFRWINPHAHIEIDGTQEGQASTVRWSVEMQAPGSMVDAGWSRDTLTIGDRITVFANPTRAAPAPGAINRALYAGIILADGRRLGRTEDHR